MVLVLQVPPRVLLLLHGLSVGLHLEQAVLVFAQLILVGIPHIL